MRRRRVNTGMLKLRGLPFMALVVLWMLTGQLVTPAGAHCWPEGSVPCAESPIVERTVVFVSDEPGAFLADWSGHHASARQSGDLIRIVETPVEGEHFLARNFPFAPGKTLELIATVRSSERTRVRLFLAGGGPASAFCDYDLAAGRIRTTAAFGGAQHGRPKYHALENGLVELICRIQLADDQSTTGVRIQLLDENGSGLYTGDPDQGLLVSKLVINAF
jgi:hypothetical protein